jgi:GNAT superfamily N-acetyltransferase
MAITIRPATKTDVGEILRFIKALALYERGLDQVTATEEDLRRDGFGPRPFFECLIADLDSKPAGFALYFYNYSTWKGQPGIYLEDLFVEPELRGLGIGKALLERVAQVAIEKGCRRLQWQVLDWNTPAIDFYAARGGEFMDEWRAVRLNDEALERLARGTELESLAAGGELNRLACGTRVDQAAGSGAGAPGARLAGDAESAS